MAGEITMIKIECHGKPVYDYGLRWNANSKRFEFFISIVDKQTGIESSIGGSQQEWETLIDQLHNLFGKNGDGNMLKQAAAVALEEAKAEIERLRAELATVAGNSVLEKKVTGADACPKCNGTGCYLGTRMMWKQKCRACNGSGRDTKKTTGFTHNGLRTLACCETCGCTDYELSTAELTPYGIQQTIRFQCGARGHYNGVWATIVTPCQPKETP